MMLIKTYVAPSPISGVGVFSAEFVAKGAKLWEIHPRFDLTFTPADIDKLPESMKDFFATYSYRFAAQPDAVMVNLDNSRFMNHTLDANTNFAQFNTGWAVRDIQPGEELTCNYHEFDPTFAGAFEVAR